MVVRSLLTLLGFQADNKKLNSYGQSLQKVVNIAKVAAVAIIGFGTAVLKLGGDMEQTEIAFETMLKSTEKADALIKEITQFAAKTPFQLTGLIQSSKQLLAFGFQSEEIITTMTNLGNIAAGVGRDKLPTLVGALGKIRTKGTAGMEELNMLLEAGVPILNQLAKNYGKTTAEVREMVSKGKVGFDDVNKALSDMATGNGMFANLMEKQSKSFLGIISNIGDWLTNAGVAIGKELLPMAKALAKTFLDFLQANEGVIKSGLVKFFKGVMRAIAFVVIFIRELIKRMGVLEGVGDSIGGIFQFLGKIFFFVLKVVGKIIKILWPFHKIILILIVALKAWAIIQGILNIIMAVNPITWIIIAIIALIAAIALLIKNWDKIKKALTAGWNAVVNFLSGIWNKIVNGLKSAWSAVGNFFKGMWEGIVGFFLKAWEAIVKIATKIPRKIIDWLMEKWEALGSFFSNLWDGITSSIKNAWESVISGLKDIWNSFINFIQPIIDAISSVFEFFGFAEKPETKMTPTTSPGGGTVNVNSNINMGIPAGTPEEQARYIEEKGREAVRKEWESIMSEPYINTTGLGF